MPKKKMRSKALNLADHKLRLATHGQPQSSGNAWLVAVAAAGAGLALILFLALMPGLEALLKKRLKAGRFKHTRGVVKTAVRLATRHGVSVKKVALAAWLHDCAKAMDRDQMKKLLKVARLDSDERKMPPLWHAPLGAWLARHEYGVKDAEILQAIRVHSTGAPRMTRLQKVLFVADYTEPGRPHWPELPALRRLSMKNLDLAFLETLGFKLGDLLKSKRHLHKRSVAAYHYELKLMAR